MTGTTLIATLATATLTGLTLTLYPTFRLRQQHAVRQLILIGLGVYTDKFHIDHITLLKTGLLHSLETLVINL
jgi:hypothetical protein